MKYELVNEYEISVETSKQLNELLIASFPETEYARRDYFKQLPHYRIIAIENGQVIGQLGIDFRAMNLNGEAVNIFGVIDLCVHLKYRKQGIAKQLMLEMESTARANSQKVDFLFLVADETEFYEKLGFEKVIITTQWLKINQHINYGLGHEKIEDVSFMIKPISGKKWASGELDYLGYMY